jgi:hypothetical protein
VIKKIAPMVVALGILAVVIVINDPAKIAASLGEGRPLYAAPFALMLAFAYMTLQSFFDTRLLRATPRPPSYTSVWAGKAGSAVLAAVGHIIGSGGYALWIARSTGAGAALAAAIVTLVLLSDLGALGVVATIASLAGGAEVPRAAIAFAGGAVGVVFVVVLVARRVKTGKLALLRTVSLSEVAIQVAGRTLGVSSAVSFTALGMSAFGLDVPPVAALSLLPLLLFVGVLPVNVAGFGAAQAAWVLLLAPWVEGADAVAFQLSWQLSLNVAFVIRGLPVLGRAMREARAPIVTALA